MSADAEIISACAELMFAYGEVEGEFPRAARKFSILLYFALAFILGAEISRAFNGKGAKERKSPREGEILLLPSSRQGRRLLEAQGEFRPLRRSTRALPLTHKLLKKLDQNFIAVLALIKSKIFEQSEKIILPTSRSRES